MSCRLNLRERREKIPVKKSTRRKNRTIVLPFDQVEYLDKIDNDVINYGEDEVIKKVERQKKAPINKTIIKSTLINDMKSMGFVKTELEGEKIVTKMFDNMESKRETKSIVELKRRQVKKPKVVPVQEK